MTTFTIHAAKTNLSKLIARAEAGEEVVLARGDVPVARLVPIVTSIAIEQPETAPEVPPAKRRIGGMKGMFSFDENVFKPLTDDEMIAYGFE